MYTIYILYNSFLFQKKINFLKLIWGGDHEFLGHLLFNVFYTLVALFLVILTFFKQ